jgi:nicotinate-nucleotide--dimethylbenzimidazole phosphoribosyltransferase
LRSRGAISITVARAWKTRGIGAVGNAGADAGAFAISLTLLPHARHGGLCSQRRERAMPEPVVTDLGEIRALLAHLPGPDVAARAAAAAREAQLTKPAGALGRLEELAAWLAMWQARHPPRLEHPRTVVFAGNHGVAARGVSAYPAAVTAQMVQNFIAGGAAVNQLCRTIDADLRVYEMNLDQPTGDIVDGPAMSEAECAHALAYGMMAVEPGIDALAVGEMGIANTTIAAALCLALFGGDAAEWTGPGTGVAGAALDNKRAVVAAAVARHRGEMGDPFDVLRRLGGREFAAMAGAILAARMGHVPVVLDGFCSAAAAAVLYAADEHALDHCVAGHVSAEPGHRRLLEKIGKKPLLDLGMRLGEASGATLALSILKAAVACHSGMATFADAGVSGPA